MIDHEQFRAGQRTVDLDAIVHTPVRVAYTDVGQGDPVLLLHGIPTWSYLYADVLPVLSRDHRVIAPDLLGHGWSDRRDCFDRSLVVQARMVLRLMDELDIERASVVGHDTGGGVGQILAVEHPDRLTKLVLTNAVAYDSWPIDDMIALGDPTWQGRTAAEVAAFLDEGLADGLSRADRLTPQWRRAILAPYQDEEGKLSIIRCAAALNTNHTTALTDRLHTIVAPSLIVWGVDDPWQPIGDAERLVADIPGALLVRIANASHWLPHDAPAEFTEQLDHFLS